MDRVEPLDTTIRIVTPENVVFRFRLAGPFRRLFAYLLDGLFRIVMIAVAALVVFLVGVQFHITAVFGLMLVSYFVIEWGYGFFLETYFNGQTLGKMALGIRVVSTSGVPITGQQAVLRNFLRVVDLMFYWLVGAAAFVLTQRFQRIGDLAADTMVVVDEKVWLGVVTEVEPSKLSALMEELPASFEVDEPLAEALNSYVGRRIVLGAARRREVAAHLAKPLAHRLALPENTDPDLLLCALYNKTCV